MLYAQSQMWKRSPFLHPLPFNVAMLIFITKAGPKEKLWTQKSGRGASTCYTCETVHDQMCPAVIGEALQGIVTEHEATS